MNLKDQKIRTKVLIGATGVLALAGLGIGAANAATPVTTQTTTAETATPGDPAANASDSGTDVQQNGDHTDPGDAPGSP